MSLANIPPNGSIQQWIVGRPEPAGQFTAQVVGVPELRATAATRDEAIQQIRAMLVDWLASGQLMSIEVPCPNPLLHFSGHLDPNDLLEQEFVEELTRRRREDLEETQREDGQECSNSSSTPTT
jgi:hypothetical protein